MQLKLARLAGHVRSGQTSTDAFFALADNENPAHALGRVLNLIIQLPAEPNLVALPVQAIYDGNKIYRVIDERLQSIRIERIGEYQSPTDGYQILVRGEAIAAQDLIITTQLPRAINGLLVDLANAQEESLEPSATL